MRCRLVQCACLTTCSVPRRILQLQWKQDFDKAVQYLQKAIDMDEKCQFAYETFGSIQVQRWVAWSRSGSRMPKKLPVMHV